MSLPGRIYTPGEVFEAELTDDVEERLIRLGAIETVRNTQNVIVRKAEEPEAPDEDEPAEDEAEDADAPEIDVMDGIVENADPEPEPEATTVKRTRKRSNVT